MSDGHLDNTSAEEPKQPYSAHEVVVISFVALSLIGFFVKIMFF